MKISIGSDHGGFDLKEALISWLKEKYSVHDAGCFQKESCDYPLFAKDVVRDILDKKADFGILICTTGIGMSIAANRYPGIRAALVCGKDAAYFARAHNNANIICLGAKYHSIDDAKECVDIFLNTAFLEGRHKRRIDLIDKRED